MVLLMLTLALMAYGVVCAAGVIVAVKGRL